MPSKNGYLSFEDGEVRLGDDLLPGILVSVTVSAGVKFDRAERDHMSGETRTPQGWEDADIKVTLDLLTDGNIDSENRGIKTTCYDKLALIDYYFKGADKGATPMIYALSGRHFYARGIRDVVFSGLQSDEDDQSDVIRAVLAFSEHIPAVAEREKKVNAQKKAVGSSAAKSLPAIKASPKPAAAIMKDTTNAFLEGYKAGNQ